MDKIIKYIFIFIGAGLGAYLGAFFASILGFHENIPVRSGMFIGIIILAFCFLYIFKKLEKMKYFQQTIYTLSSILIIVLILIVINIYLYS